MIDTFATALKTAVTSMVTDVTTAIGDNLAVVLPLTLGIVGIGIVWAVIRRFSKAR